MTKREYPTIYERFVPLILGVLAMGIIVLLLIIVSVVLGIFPFTG